MTEHLHARAQEIFRRALAVAPDHRDELVLRECGGDTALRGQVEALLEQQGETTDVSVEAAAVVDAQSALRVSRPAVDRFQAGDLFNERYRIVALLGRGGMGEVYRARDLVLDVPVAVKLVRGASAVYRERMLAEVRLAREVTHPAVCRVYDVGEAGDQLYFTMEYVDGEDLSSLVRRIGRLPSDKVAEIALQICAGLAAAHARGVIHRDLKPANVMIDGRGKVRITDFGLAVLASDVVEGTVAGTPAYMAPEQLTGGQLGPAADIYSVGLILYELLTGRPAFRGASFSEIFTQKLARDPEPPSRAAPGVDLALERVILRAASRQPEARFSSTLAMAAALPGGDALAMAVEAGTTPDPSLIAAAELKSPLPRRTAWALLAALVLLLLGVMVLAAPARGLDELGAMKAPRVLADRVERMLEELGFESSPGDPEWGFVANPSATSAADAVLFWYREGSLRETPEFVRRVIEASSFEAGLEVPDAVRFETVLVMVDHSGRLVYLHDGPAFGAAFASGAAGDSDYDWAGVLALTGLDDATLVVEPASRLPVFADNRSTWLGSVPGRPGLELRIQAAALAGRPVYFAAERLEPDADLRRIQLARRDRLRWWTYTPLFAVVGLAALGMGIANVVFGRSHLRGAAVLMTVVAAVECLARLLSAGHPESPLASSRLVVAGGVFAVVAAALAAGLCYLGLEPIVRRRMPHNLIAWNRLLSGRLRDGAVGASLLTGAVAGAALALAAVLDGLVVRWLGLEGSSRWLTAAGFNAVIGLGTVLATVFGLVNAAIVGGILLLALRVLLARLLRKPWLAAPAFVTAVGAVVVVQWGSHLPVSWLTFGLPAGAIALAVSYRAGLLALVVSVLTFELLASVPITSQTAAWFAAGGLAVVVAVLLIGIVGFLVSRPNGRAAGRAESLPRLPST